MKPTGCGNGRSLLTSHLQPARLPMALHLTESVCKQRISSFTHNCLPSDMYSFVPSGSKCHNKSYHDKRNSQTRVVMSHQDPLTKRENPNKSAESKQRGTCVVKFSLCNRLLHSCLNSILLHPKTKATQIPI